MSTDTDVCTVASYVASYLSSLLPRSVRALIGRPAVAFDHRWIVTTASDPLSIVHIQRTTALSDAVVRMSGREQKFLGSVQDVYHASNAASVSDLQRHISHRIKETCPRNNSQLRTLVKEAIKGLIDDETTDLNVYGREEWMGPWGMTHEVKFRDETEQPDASKPV